MKEKFLDYILHHREKSLKILVACIFLMIAVFILLGKEGENQLVIEGEEPLPQEEFQEEAGSLDSKMDMENREIVVHVSGAVKRPGVLMLPEGSRIYEAIEKAGGLAPDSDTDGVNMARSLRDEEKIHIPREGESLETESGTSVSGNQSIWADPGKVHLININTADSSALQTLTGIGPSTAAKIIEYRQYSGPFRSTEQIKEVSGIGDKTYTKFKDKICI